MYEQIVKTVDGMTEELVTTRRDFHKYAESGWFEMRTSSIIARKLTELGLDEVLVGEQVCKREARMGVPSEEALEKSYQRAVEQGGVAVGGEKVVDIKKTFTVADIPEEGLVLRRGKKNFRKVVVK